MYCVACLQQHQIIFIPVWSLVMKMCPVHLQMSDVCLCCVLMVQGGVKMNSSAWYGQSLSVVQMSRIFSSVFTQQRKRQHDVSSLPMKVFFTPGTSSFVGRGGFGFLGRGNVWGGKLICGVRGIIWTEWTQSYSLSIIIGYVLLCFMCTLIKLVLCFMCILIRLTS